jgi:cytoskeletal protein RodZ
VGDDNEQIGWQLRTAREAAGLEIDDIVFRTRIPRSVVEALEAEDFSVFTSPVYAKSFLAQYSDFLNVDAHPWLDALEPGSFMPGGHLGTLVEEAESFGVAKAPPQETRGGLLSVLGLLTLSSAVVVGSIKCYETFERRFGEENHGTRHVPAAVSAPAMISSRARERKPVVQKEDALPADPTPRAIIVR